MSRFPNKFIVISPYILPNYNEGERLCLNKRRQKDTIEFIVTMGVNAHAAEEAER
ncbi:hypothetical protein PAT3040_04915 [Paenibacillus agaridevorans]|uniref:Uncharacterized protein n=1 Tax=Paenibacillus agaridevorans TaxID=171404 RepID=A0A2R5EUH3_9BACL|nr:hypothetical protein PAT3040_04915 [Paenibacillus agaridevorans]